MFSTVLSGSIYGMDCRLVHVETDVGDGLPVFSMVGYLSAQVKEAQDRVRTALKNSGFRLEPKRVTVNLSPANLRKSGSGFDLPIAVAIAAGYGRIPGERLKEVLIAGELSLNGDVNGIAGILPMAALAAECGLKACLVPKSNEREAAVIPGIQVIGVSTLEETIEYLQRGKKPENKKETNVVIPKDQEPEADFQDINGLEVVKRAVEVAVSGFHNLLLTGPPGSGKSMIAKRIPGILPPMTLEESLEVSKVYSVAGLLPPGGSLLLKRPFRSPHHTATARALAGGGNIPNPGELSLAHNGVLFLDELPEFRREVMEVLRQPLEDRKIKLVRSGGVCEFPGRIMLVGAMNPCPCGYYPDLARCVCTERAVQNYRNRISGPLLDRLDLTIEVPRVEYDALCHKRASEGSREIRKRVEQTWEIQKERYRGDSYRFNSELRGEALEKYCRLGAEENELMKAAFEKLELGARSYYRILKVARTIADMEGSDTIRRFHLQEALCYRNLNRNNWIGR